MVEKPKTNINLFVAKVVLGRAIAI